LISYLEKADPGAAKIALHALACFERHGGDERLYAQHARAVPAHCREEILDLLIEVRKRSMFYDEDEEARLNTEQNAYIAVNAEKYYRSMLSFNDDSWNIRDRHMADTLERLIDFHGKDTKAILWEHNTHLGDARYTDMKKARMLNVGQLVREKYGEDNTVIVGFGSHSGKVMAGRSWNAPMEKMNVPDAREGSIEDILHNESSEDRLLIFNRKNKKERFTRTIYHRAIGVVYHPELEYHNYVPSELNGRYDAFIYLDRTNAVHAMHFHPDGHQVPETYPFEF
jgi:erythromycin esterase-like protein